MKNLDPKNIIGICQEEGKQFCWNCASEKERNDASLVEIVTIDDLENAITVTDEHFYCFRCEDYIL